MSRITVNPEKATSDAILDLINSLVLSLNGWKMLMTFGALRGAWTDKETQPLLRDCIRKQKTIAQMRELIVTTTPQGTTALGMVDRIGRSIKQLGVNAYEQEPATLKQDVETIIGDLHTLEAYLQDRIRT